MTRLLNCIFGVDIDYNAIEVTQFSLCIKLLEDETKTSIKQMQKILPKIDSFKPEFVLISAGFDAHAYSGAS